MIEIWHPGIQSGQASQSAYDEIYAGQGIRLLDSFYLWLLALLKPKPEACLLDVSCGQGRLVTLAQRQKMAAYGIDFSPAAVLRGRREGGWGLLVGDGTRLPFPDRVFDYVTCIGSLEHYLQPEAGMADIRRVLAEHGTACILLPNTFSLLGNVNYARSAAMLSTMDSRCSATTLVPAGRDSSVERAGGPARGQVRAAHATHVGRRAVVFETAAEAAPPGSRLVDTY